MANEGYLIGYEDAQGNFVQIGQFNNAADDVTQPLVLRHTNSGETLELDGSSFRPSTQIGDTNNRPDVFANTVDLNSLVGAGLDTKADLTQSGGVLVSSQVPDLGLDTKADLTQSDGVLVSSQLPDLAITNIDVVADQSARLALNAEEGDVAIQTDISETFILSTNDPTVDSNWKKVQLDVLGAIDGQQITPAQTGTSSNRTDVVADTVDTNQLTGVSTGVNTQGCRVFLNNNQGVSGFRPKIKFDTKAYDSGGNFDTSAHNWTCPKDGLYMAHLQVHFSGGNDDERRNIRIGTGSSGTPNNEGAASTHNSSDTGDVIQTVTINKYSSGDSIAGYVRTNSTDSLRGGDGNDRTFLEVAFLGGL